MAWQGLDVADIHPGVTLTELKQTTAVAANGTTYTLADQVSVCIRETGGTYYPVELKDLSTTNYTLTGYYDAAGQKIRVIVAR